MKPTSLLLIASLLANVALLALVATRSTSPSAAPQPAIGADAGRPATPSSGRDEALRAALASGNTKELEAAGLTPALARDLAVARSLAKIAEKSRAAKAGAPADPRWWRNTAGPVGPRDQLLLQRRELSEALLNAFGDDLGLSAATDQFAFLPPDKRDALRRITQDYDEMIAKFSAGGVQLASDKEKLRLLRAERERDIAALLSPEERLAYEMRTSPTAATVKARFGDGIQSEDDYRKIYALQKAFEEKFPAEALNGRVTPEAMRARGEAQRQLQEDIRSALGESNYAALRRATDPDLRTVDSLVTRLNLPASTTDRVATARETFAAESQRINADSAVPFPQRRSQIQELGARARAEVQQALGSEAADAYAQRSPWLGLLQNGLAYSTAPQPNSPSAMMAGAGNQSVFPIMPAGTPGGTGTRQMIIANTSTTSDAPAGHGELVLSGPGNMVRENVQVMTFSSSSSSEPGAAPVDGAGPIQRTIIVAPPPAAPPPK